MRIGLIGAPGSGKTAIAKELADKFDLDVIDGYAEKWSERTGLTHGFTGGYAHTLGIALDRIYEESKSEKEDRGFVTCGTTLDSLIYMAIMSLKNPNAIEFTRAKAYMEMVSMLFFDFWTYDHVYVCRLTDPKPIGDNEPKSAEEYIDHFEHNQSIKYDEEITDSLESFFNVKTNQLPSDGRLEFILKNIEDKKKESEKSNDE